MLLSAIPLHPAVVHVPLGAAVILPLVAIGLLIAIWRGALGQRAWWVVVGLQLVLVGGSLVALRTGEDDEERVEERVQEAPIERHEDSAKVFAIAGGVALALGLGGALLRRPRAFRAAATATALATVVVAGLAVNTGKQGGELVYSHGAASVFTSPAGVRAAELLPGDSEHEGAAERGDD